MIAEPASVAIETTAPSNARAASEIDMRDEVEPISEARPEPRTANAVPAVLVPVVAAAPLQQSAPTGSAFERQLLAAPAQSFTLQILAASSEANVQAFVERNRSGLRQALGYYRSQRAGAPWFVVVYGEFATREEADATLNRLPEALSAAGPWARPITAAQAEIRAAQ